MAKYDITLVTCPDYLTAANDDEFTKGVISDDTMLKQALEKRGLKVARRSWDDKSFNWSDTRYAVFRTPWDYFSRYEEFAPWLENTAKLTQFINPIEIINHNIDKHYLLELEKAGANIPPTIFIEPGDTRSLTELCATTDWNEFILKPAVSGGAWHTYRFTGDNITEHEKVYNELIAQSSMMLQQYQESISEIGELSFLLFGGRFSHAVLKKTAPNDFRVQAYLGGTVEDYSPTTEDIKFAEHVVKISEPGIAYARVDVMWDNDGRLSLIELELIEPELWLRRNPPAAELFADILLKITKG